jgi:hypothetical protein
MKTMMIRVKMKTNVYLIDVPVIQIDNRQIVLLAHF